MISLPDTLSAWIKSVCTVHYEQPQPPPPYNHPHRLVLAHCMTCPIFHHLAGGLTKIGKKTLTPRRLQSIWFLCSTFDHSVLVGADLINNRHTLVKWCSHEEIYLLTVMPPSTLCFQGSRVWLATIVTNTNLHDFSSLTPHRLLCAVGGWAWKAGRVEGGQVACMLVICTTLGELRGFHCRGSRVQNTLMDPNKTPF